MHIPGGFFLNTPIHGNEMKIIFSGETAAAKNDVLPILFVPRKHIKK
jgi:hypothetical protein